MDTKMMVDSAPTLQLRQPDTSSVTKTKNDFGSFLSESIEKVSEAQIQGDLAIQNLQTGKAEHLHEVMIAVEQADISLKMLVQMRNKAQQAYEEIMRLQI